MKQKTIFSKIGPRNLKKKILGNSIQLFDIMHCLKIDNQSFVTTGQISFNGLALRADFH